MRHAIYTLSAALSCIFLLVTASAAQGTYRIANGDRLNIEVLEDTSLNRAVVVLPDGSFTFPFAGSVRARGRTPEQVQRAITSAIASNFAAAPNVFVSVEPAPVVPRAPKPAPTIQVYFLGEVNEPGVREVKPGTTFLQAVALSGGLTNFAATKRIQVRRTSKGSTGRQSLFKFDYKALLDGAPQSSDFIIQDGDVIVVPERRLFE